MFIIKNDFNGSSIIICWIFKLKCINLENELPVCYYYYYYFTPCKFFTSALIGGLSLETEG